MSLRSLLLVSMVVFISTEAVSAVDVKKAVGDRVSFRPDKLIPSVTSIIWKHINTAGITVKVIEWDEGEILIPNPRFRDITTVDEKTGQITITNLKVEHSGVYTIDINSKEQQQRFTLTVMERVPKPVIKTEKSKDNPDVVYLICEYNETIIWKNSAGETLKGSKHDPKGVTLRVKYEGNRVNFYTCTLKNTVSEETSDPLYEKDLERVPKPVIKIEKIKDNPDVVNLICEYSETIIWKNSAGETLKGSKHDPKGETLRVKYEGNRENFYTCTLKNAVSEETSDPLYEKDLVSNKGRAIAASIPWITIAIIMLLL
ncbi:CD48 antigen-like isoform X1 [Chanodichthys erythropterus]|uniref:CD48 antigen-like isoform X1 n=1 Tax=Chanodichthys erythropterus TaxID=933992 RepID=UPI00351E69AC